MEVRESKQIAISYRPFNEPYKPKDVAVASVLFVTGTAGKPQVSVNGKDVSEKMRSLKVGQVETYAVPLTDALPTDDELCARPQAVSAPK